MLGKVKGKFYRYTAANNTSDNLLEELLVCMTENLNEGILSFLFFRYWTTAPLFPHKFPLMLHCKVQFEGKFHNSL